MVGKERYMKTAEHRSNCLGAALQGYKHVELLVIGPNNV